MLTWWHGNATKILPGAEFTVTTWWRFLPFGLSGRRGIVVACVCLSVCPSARKLYLVRTITRHRFELESPNLHQTCTTGHSVGIENGGHWLWPSRSFWLRILGNLTCPRNNSSQIWARITKFALNMHPVILSTGIENGGNWPGSSMSFWPFHLELWEIWLVCSITCLDLS